MTPFGFSGNILHVDLTSKKYWIENPDEIFYRTYWGGRSLALYYMLKEMNPKIDPFSEKNLLIFSTSVIVGAPVSGVTRYTVCAKSPLTGAHGEAEAAGWWGPELKKAGFDAIIIRGVSSEPVFIWIKDGKVEIRNAMHLWGKDTGTVQELIKKELQDDKIRIAQIGPAAENLVRFANIVNELRHFNGRCGLGAVMGSKKLKAIAVRGTKSIKLYNRQKINEVAKRVTESAKSDPFSKDLKVLGTAGGVRYLNEEGSLPTRNWTIGGFGKKGEKLSGETMNKTILKKTEGCYACTLRCKRVVEVNESDIKVDPLYGGPEYETIAALGSLCGIDDLRYVSKGNELCSKYTMDTISTGSVIAFAMQCYKEGILTKEDTDGIELSFGNKTALIQMIENIAMRRGLGDILAQGVFRASKLIGKGSEKFAYHVKKQELPMHDPRVKPGVGLQYALADYGADHVKAPHDPCFTDKDFRSFKVMSGLGLIEPVPSENIGEEKVRMFKIIETYWTVLDILGVCYFCFVPYGGSMEDLLEIIYASTGWRTTWFELMRAGERSSNMAKIYNLREGFSPKDDTLPEIFYKNFKGGPLNGKKAINKLDFEKAIKLRYEIMGWDPETSIPSKGKLIDLGLSWIIDKVKIYD